jgi:Cys-tRNA(Pro) deacylase
VSWPESVERVAQALRSAATDARLEEFPEPTRTAAEAAAAAGCEQSLIVKSLVFVCDGRPVLALVPGDRRADAARVAQATGAAEARVANAAEVTAATGVDPGGVSPVGVGEGVRVFLDRSLVGPERLWVGGGSDRHMVAIAPADLVRITRAEVADLAA